MARVHGGDGAVRLGDPRSEAVKRLCSIPEDEGLVAVAWGAASSPTRPCVTRGPPGKAPAGPGARRLWVGAARDGWDPSRLAGPIPPTGIGGGGCRGRGGGAAAARIWLRRGPKGIPPASALATRATRRHLAMGGGQITAAARGATAKEAASAGDDPPGRRRAWSVVTADDRDRACAPAVALPFGRRGFAAGQSIPPGGTGRSWARCPRPASRPAAAGALQKTRNEATPATVRPTRISVDAAWVGRSRVGVYQGEMAG